MNTVPVMFGRTALYANPISFKVSLKPLSKFFENLIVPAVCRYSAI